MLWVCVCTLRYPACKAHVPLSFVLYMVLQYFTALSHERKGFRKKVIVHKMDILIPCTASSWNISLSKKNWARDEHKFTFFFIEITRHSCPILTKLEVCRHIFEKYSNIKFHENPSSGSWVVASGLTDMAKLTVAFLNVVISHKNR